MYSIGSRGFINVHKESNIYQDLLYLLSAQVYQHHHMFLYHLQKAPTVIYFTMKHLQWIYTIKNYYGIKGSITTFNIHETFH